MRPTPDIYPAGGADFFDPLGWTGTDQFIPHGVCLSWDTDLITAVVLFNGVIALAYFIIAGILVHEAVRKKPVVPRIINWFFSAFIFCCGTAHVIDNVTLWVPVYRLQAIVMGITALTSIFAAILPIGLWMRHEINQ